MTEHLHPQRETYPLVTADDEFVSVCRGHIPPNMRPTLTIKALGFVELRLDESKTLDDRAGYEVLDFSAGSGNTVTLTVNGGGATVLTEGAAFDAVISNEETAIQIAAAINTAAVGLVATTEVGKPFVFVAADPTFAAGITAFTLASDDLLAWTPDNLASVGTLVVLNNQQTTELDLGTRDVMDLVGFLRIIRGKVALDLRSPVEVRTYLRQPATLSGNTGHPGGWPTSP
jgi:hypothetical protein